MGDPNLKFTQTSGDRAFNGGGHSGCLSGNQRPVYQRGGIGRSTLALPDGSTPDQENNAAEYQKTIEDYKNKSLQDIIQICKERHPTWDETEFLQWAKGKQLTSPNTAEYLRTEQRDWLDTVKNLRVPGLLLTADLERGAIVTPETAQVVGQHWKKGQIVHLPGAGHSIHREQYYKYRDEVKSFLRKVL